VDHTVYQTSFGNFFGPIFSEPVNSVQILKSNNGLDEYSPLVMDNFAFTTVSEPSTLLLFGGL
jgi:hypothetical protein